MFRSKNPALIVIDVQYAIDHFSNSERNNVNAESHIASLIRLWRRTELPIIHVRHASKFTDSPYHPESKYFAFKPEVAPLASEPIITKSENSAFIGTELDDYLKKQKVQELVMCGVLTNNSIDATVRVASGLGYSVFVPHQGAAAFGMELLTGAYLDAEQVHWTFLSNLDGEYCRVCSIDDIRAFVAE